MQSEKRAILNKVREGILSPLEADRQLHHLMDSRRDHILNINNKIEEIIDSKLYEVEFISDLIDLDGKIEDIVNSKLKNLEDVIDAIDIDDDFEKNLGVLF